jgi:hypothetical protein
MTDPPAEPVEPTATRADHHGTGVDHPTDDKRKKRPLVRALMRIIIALVLLTALLVTLAPMLLSTGPGTRLLVNFVNTKTPGDLAVDDLSLSWFGGQRVEGITYDDPAKGLQATIATLVADEVGLFDLLTGSRRLGQVTLSDGDLILTQIDMENRAGFEQSQVDPMAEAQLLQLPPSLSGTLTVNNLSATYQPIQSKPIKLTLKQDEIKIADLRDITFEMNADVKQGLKKGSVSLKGNVLNLFDPEGVIQAGQAAYDITLQVQGVPTLALGQVMNGMNKGIKPGRVVAVLGDGELVSRATVKGTIEQLTSDLSITTPKLRVELDQRTEGTTLIASPESYARLSLDQTGFAALFPQSGLKLAEPTRIDLASLQMILPVVDQAIDWDSATASLLIKAGDNLAVIDERGEKLWINNLQIAGGSESIADKLTFKLTTMLSAVTVESDVTEEDVAVDLVISEPMAKTRQIDFFSKALPIQLADALAGQDGKLVLYLGKMLSLQADMQGKVVTDEQGNLLLLQQFSLRPEGRVNGTVSGTFAKGRFTLATPVDEPVEAVLVPEAFASLMDMLTDASDQPALTIDKDMPVYLTIRDPDRGPVSIITRRDKAGLEGFYPDPDQTRLGATIELSAARVFDPKLKKTYELRGGSITLSAPDLRGQTQIRAELDLWVRPDAGQDGVASLLTWQTTVTDLLDTEGNVPLDTKTLMQQLAAEGGLQSRNVPSGLLDALLDRNGDLASILGPIVQQMDAGFTYKDGQPTGATVRLNWDDKTNQPIADSWASMKPAAFDIDEQQMMTVRGGEDLELEVRVSEDFGDRWMGKLHPVLFDAKSGDRPVKIKIDGKSFRFPLANASSKIKLELDGKTQYQPNPDYLKGSQVQASVDLGTIRFGDDALLGKIMEWTKRSGERAIFEPATVSLIDGQITYDKLDLAVGNVKLRFDGDVDLVSGRIGEMFVRVPGDSLIRVFNELDGVIKPDDFLSIPMTGEIRKPEFDSNRIGREVARLVAEGLLDQQKDKLGDLIKREIGGDKKPKPDGDAEPKEQDPAQDAAEDLINRGLDLLFKRLGKDKNEPKKNE